MGWVSPISHSDPLGGWINGVNAYDNNLGTYARGGSGDKYLQLNMGGDITTYKVRIYGSTFTGGDASGVSIGSSIWKYWTGTVPALTWFEIEFNALLKISGVNIYRATDWRIYEFQFWDGVDGYQSPAPEDYIVENESVIPDALSNQMQRKLVVGPDGRIHCVFRKYSLSIDTWKVYYAYSDDYGKTWTVEDPAPFLTHIQYSPSIAVDSSGNPHVVFHHALTGAAISKYLKRTAGGSWTISDIYTGSFGDRRYIYSWTFTAGDVVKGLTSEVIKTITFVTPLDADTKLFGFLGGGSGLIVGETLSNQTDPGNTVKYQGESGAANTGTALAIKSNNDLVLVSNGPGAHTWYWIKPSSSSTFKHAAGWVGPGSGIAVDIGPNNGTHIVYRSGNSYYYGTQDQFICTGTYGTGYPFQYFSIASDSSNNVHFVVAQEGVGGSFSDKLNIKYYKRTSGVWSGPIHITDVNFVQGNPSISIDTQGRIHVMWQGKGWGTYPSRYSLLMRTYENGAWGETQIILNEDKDQGKYGASLLHAWHPSSNRLREPVYIFNRQGSWKIQFGGDLSYGVGRPDNLLCEQTKNPTNVSDPNPEFSAIYRSE